MGYIFNYSRKHFHFAIHQYNVGCERFDNSRGAKVTLQVLLKILLTLVVITRADVNDDAVVLIMLILTSSAEVCYDVDLAFVIHLADLRGLAPHLLHVTPNVCIIFAVYESVMRL